MTLTQTIKTKMRHCILLLMLLTITSPCFSQWNQKGIDIDGEAIDDQSGNSTSLSSDGNTLAIGARLNDETGLNAGHVRVYEWIGSVWIQKGLDLDAETPGDQFGFAISLSSDGNTIAIGGPGNGGGGSNSGHVRIFEWIGSAWVQKGQDIDGEASSNVFGGAVSLSSDGNTVIIGATLNGGLINGHAQVYEWMGSAWTQKGNSLIGEAAFDNYGKSVQISGDGNTISISSANNDGGGSNAGHVRVFEWIASAWVQKGLDIDGDSAGDQSGVSTSLSLDGNSIAIGAPFNDGGGVDAGHVKIYEWIGGAWIQKGMDIDGEAAGDESGSSVSLSSDGSTIAIGAQFNTGNGLEAGHARVYEWSAGVWIPKGIDLDSENPGDQFGKSVSLNSDGSILSIGGIYNDGFGLDAGHVQVYEWSSLVCSNPDVPAISSSTPVICQGDSATLNISGNLNDATTWEIYSTSCGSGLDGSVSGNSYSINPSNTITYYIRGEGGCVVPGTCGTITIVVNPSPLIQIDSISDVLCNGALSGSVYSTTGGGTSPLSIDWDNDGTGDNDDLDDIFNLGAGLYHITLTDANGCTSIDSALVIEAPLLLLTSTTTDEINGNDGGIDLNVSGGAPPYTYDWDNDGTGDNDDSEDLSTLTAGSYSVVVIDANGCSENITVIVNSQLGFESQKMDISSLFPNPSNGQINVQFSQNFTGQLSIFNSLGQIAFTSSVTGSNFVSFDLSNLENGIYIVHFENLVANKKIKLVLN
jgi:Secretion system C-terminal sorting domain/SprB repeat/Ig-like domain CHU_C associated